MVLANRDERLVDESSLAHVETIAINFMLITAACLGILSIFSSLAFATQISISANFTNGSEVQKAVVNAAIRDWESVLCAPDGKSVNVTLDITFMDLGLRAAGNTTLFVADSDGLPISATLQMNNSTVLMFYDPTPFTANDIPRNQIDALYVARHEIAHVLGFGVQSQWQDCVNGTRFNCKGVSATLTADQTHLSPTAHPDDLMNPSIASLQDLGRRRPISTLDIQMLEAAFGYSAAGAGSCQNDLL